jgi:3-hydroxyisobutyrate dehydrogenase-like beta-hydroxyacid dehydrogenase
VNHKIGILGAGNMGLPISCNIAEDGHEVFVYDIAYNVTVEKYKGKNITVVMTPKELVEKADIIVFIVKDTTITTKNIDCENGLLQGLNGKKIFVDLTTSDPQESEKMENRIIAAGGNYIDIPMTGGQIGAINRKLVMMGSGDREVFEEVRYIFEPLSKKLFYLGEKVGLGHFMKLIHNQLSGAVFMATCEAVFLGQSFGMDPKVMIDVFNEGNARSCATEMKFPKFVLSGTLNAGCSVGILQKDMNLVLNKAKEKSFKLPITQATYDYWNGPVQEGNPDLDYAAMLKYMEKLV